MASPLFAGILWIILTVLGVSTSGLYIVWAMIWEEAWPRIAQWSVLEWPEQGKFCARWPLTKYVHCWVLGSNVKTCIDLLCCFFVVSRQCFTVGMWSIAVFHHQMTYLFPCETFAWSTFLIKIKAEDWPMLWKIKNKLTRSAGWQWVEGLAWTPCMHVDRLNDWHVWSPK